MIDFLATEPHYAAHTLPIWNGLTDAERGAFYVGRRPDAHQAVQDIEARTGLPSGSEGGPVVVAGYSDLRRVQRGRPVILVEHGVGLRYKRPDGEWDRNPSNPGGSHREAVALYLCPNREVADANLAAYPSANAAVIGCPRLDWLHAMGADAADLGRAGTVLGEGGGDPGLLALDSRGQPSGVRQLPPRRPQLHESPSGMGAPAWDATGGGSGSRVPQHRRPLPGGANLRASPLREPVPPAGLLDQGQPAGVPADVGDETRPGDPLPPGAPLRRGEHVSGSRVPWMPDVSEGTRPASAFSGPYVVAISFHWPNTQNPEAGWAFPAFARAVEQLPEQLPGLKIIGHGHPRAWRRLRPFYGRAEIEPVEDIDDVLARSSLYVCDNSSTMYEAASVGIPVLALNSPRYRRYVHHGLRFWSHVPGLQVDEPAKLAKMIELALGDPPEAQALRRAAVERAYAHTDGRAAERAVRAIREVFGGN